MKIKVTEKHIKSGARGKMTYCPIALALSESGWRTPYVLPTEARKGKYGKIHQLPRSAQRFISRFDSSKPVKPFNFVLDTD